MQYLTLHIVSHCHILVSPLNYRNKLIHDVPIFFSTCTSFCYIVCKHVQLTNVDSFQRYLLFTDIWVILKFNTGFKSSSPVVGSNVLEVVHYCNLISLYFPISNFPSYLIPFRSRHMKWWLKWVKLILTIFLDYLVVCF